MSEKRGRRREGEDGNSGRSKKSKRPLVMEQSGQTAEERRALRLKQRELKKKIIEKQSDIGDLGKDTCVELTRQNGLLFQETNFPREAVTDGENMRLIAEGAVGQIKNVNSGAVGIDGDGFLDNVKKFYSKNEDGEKRFSWSSWGGNVSMVYLSVPEGAGFMMGPLDKPAKTRKAPQRREKLTDDAEEEVPEEEAQGRKTKQKLDQTQMRISEMKAQEQGRESAGTQKDMFETLINPKSFTQTVENFFDFSFLVKTGDADITIDEGTKLPQAVFRNKDFVSGNTPPDNSEIPTQQWLMSFTPADLRDLKELYEIRESNIKHRSEGPKSDYFDPLKDGSRQSSRQ